MGKIFKAFAKAFFWLLTPVLTYLLVALVLSIIPVNSNTTGVVGDNEIFLTTNGVHLDIVIPVAELDPRFANGMNLPAWVAYVGFGWGDENFYLNTPTWGDLTFDTAYNALFMDSTTLMHVTYHPKKRKEWVAIPVDRTSLSQVQQEILIDFDQGEGGQLQLAAAGYGSQDFFYRAHGSYSLFYTCNTWANDVFKTSGLKACLWTPFDFGLLWKYG